MSPAPEAESRTQHGEVAEWFKAHAWKVCIRETVSGVRIPLSPPLSCSEPEMRPRPWAFFFLSQRRLAEAPEPRRLAPDSILSPNAHPSLTERTSHRAVRLREGQCFQHIPRSAWAHLLLPFS